MRGSIDIFIEWNYQCVHLECPRQVGWLAEQMFAPLLRDKGAASTKIVVSSNAPCFDVRGDGFDSYLGVDAADLPAVLMDVILRALITVQSGGVVLHSGLVARKGRGVMVVGPSGSGKSSLVSWLVDHGFDYLGDEISLLESGSQLVSGLRRSIVLKNGSAEIVRKMDAFRNSLGMVAASTTMMMPPYRNRDPAPLPVALIIFPKFEPGTSFTIRAVSAARCCMGLVGCNLNARNIADGGFGTLSRLAGDTAAIEVTYGSFDQLLGRLDTLVIAATEDDKSIAGVVRAFVAGIASPTSGSSTSNVDMIRSPRIPPRTARRSEPCEFTIGMSTFDDYDGVYFTLQSIRMFHSEALPGTEFLVVDNNPGGICSKELKHLERLSADYRYIPFAARTGTMVRETIVGEARSDSILLLDCHVMLWPDALRKLRVYMAEVSDSPDLLQGPMVHDDLKSLSSHFRPEWRGGMYGVWDLDERALDADGMPFEIPMQGLGLYAFRRNAWPGTNSLFRGFAAEEWYLHEKIRRNGGRALCLPFLRWIHRFARPSGTPYPNSWRDRIRNYFIAFRELEQSTGPMEEHFRNLLGREQADRLINSVLGELAESY